MLFKPGTDLALANGILHLLVSQGRIHAPFIAENVVFHRGVEDLTAIGYGCFDEQAERYTFEDQAQPSSLAELKTFLADYTPETRQRDDRRARGADPGARPTSTATSRAAPSACGAWG